MSAADPEQLGYLVPGLDALAEFDPTYRACCDALTGLAWNSGVLSHKTKALIYVAVNATTTQMNAPGARAYIRKALDLGATREEVLEVLQLASTIGIHACILGIPLLLAEIDPTGAARRSAIEGDPRRAALKADFVAKRGYWNDVWDGMVWLDPNYFAAFTAFSSAPWQFGTLAPRIKELIYIAVDTTTTHMFELGARIHIQNALRLGATSEEIVEVLQLVSAMGLNSCAFGAPILRDELARLSGDDRQMPSRERRATPAQAPPPSPA